MLRVIKPPAGEMLSFEGDIGRMHLRLDSDTDEGDLISFYGRAARSLIEHQTGRFMNLTTVQIAANGFDRDRLSLQTNPVQTIEWIKYIDPAGVEHTVSPDDYTVDNRGMFSCAMLKFGKRWPETAKVAEAVTAQFVAGYGEESSTIPDDIKMWALLQIALWYENREAAVKDLRNALPYTRDLIDKYRLVLA